MSKIIPKKKSREFVNSQLDSLPVINPRQGGTFKFKSYAMVFLEKS